MFVFPQEAYTEKPRPRNHSLHRIELTSENDLFFHFVHSVDEHSFREMQDIPGMLTESCMPLYRPLKNLSLKMKARGWSFCFFKALRSDSAAVNYWDCA